MVSGWPCQLRIIFAWPQIMHTTLTEIFQNYARPPVRYNPSSVFWVCPKTSFSEDEPTTALLSISRGASNPPELLWCQHYQKDVQKCEGRRKINKSCNSIATGTKKNLPGSLYNLSEGKMPLYKYSLSYCFIVNYLINRARLHAFPKVSEGLREDQWMRALSVFTHPFLPLEQCAAVR